MDKIITEFMEKKSWKYTKRIDENGDSYFHMGLNYNHNNYNIIFEHDFEERYFAVTAVIEKTLPVKHIKKILKIFNIIAQSDIPIIHIVTEHGMIASKYVYEILEEEIFTEKRVDFMFSRVLRDVENLYPYLKKMTKKIKKSKDKGENKFVF